MSNLKEKWLKEMRDSGNDVLKIARDGASHIIRGVAPGTEPTDICNIQQYEEVKESIVLLDNRLDDLEDGTINTDNVITGTVTITEDGTVSQPSLKVGTTENGFYEISAVQLGVSVDDSLVAIFNDNGIATYSIEEQIVDTGVRVDGLEIKDGSSGKRVSALATADGLTTGALTGSDQYISVTSTDANHIISLPISTAIPVGTTIKGYVGANGFELRVDPSEAATATINGVTTDVEAAIPATTFFTITLVATRKWILEALNSTGDMLGAIVPDAV